MTQRRDTGINLDRMFRDINARTRREEKSPLVLYDRGGSHGWAHLANITDYLLTVGGWPPDYSRTRIVRLEDVPKIREAERLIREARRAADKLYAEAYASGSPVTAEAADAARKAAER